jgi:thiamine-monophosphate kinase
MGEFDIIEKFFASTRSKRKDVVLGIGDDAAILAPPVGDQVAITTDTLISGIHFPTHTSAFDVGYKALAVNLSDLAAMGATPAWVTLALTLPQLNTDWLQGFCDGFFALADKYNVALIGGDTTQDEEKTSITVTALGLIPKNQFLSRHSAHAGDAIYVSGCLGDAGFALANLCSCNEYFLQRLNRPEPRVALGQALLSIAHTAIDISDGLIADLQHILAASKVGADINVDALPLSDALKQAFGSKRQKAIQFALTAGDDYELCFTVPEKHIAALEKQSFGIPITRIGTVVATPYLHLHYENGAVYHGATQGFEHFT